MIAPTSTEDTYDRNIDFDTVLSLTFYVSNEAI
jgi:hypothetical protein